jgi:hypothetical protein
MKRIFVPDSTLDIAQNKEVLKLAKGEIGVYGIGTNDYIYKSVGLLTDVLFLDIRLGGQAGVNNVPIDVNPSLLRMVKAPFKKPVKPVWRVKQNCYLGNSVYDEFIVKISVKGALKDTEDTNSHHVESHGVNGRFASATELYKALANVINKTSIIAKAQVDQAGLLLTTNSYGYSMDVSGDFVKDDQDDCNKCISVCWDAVEEIEFNAGSGTCEHIERLQYEYRPFTGSMEYTHVDIPYRKTLEEGCQDCNEGGYDTYIIVNTNKNHSMGEPGREAFQMVHTTVLAFATGSVAGAQFVQLMEAKTGQKFVITPIA